MQLIVNRRVSPACRGRLLLALGLSLLPWIVACDGSHRVAATPQAPISPEAIVTRSPGKLDVLSPVYEIDRVYRSMTGPWSRTDVTLCDSPAPELLWITGCQVEMVNEQANEKMPDQFMCHVNLDIDVDKHKQRFGLTRDRDERLFTLSQGQLEVHFPPGYGIPVMSDEIVSVNTQVLNLNWPNQSFEVRHHVTIEYTRDQDRQATAMRPVMQSGVVGLVSLEGREVAFDSNELLHGKCTSCCAPGKKAVDWAEGIDSYAHRFSNHWIIKPGRSEYRTRATSSLNLANDATIHTIAVHVHPYAESLELRDLTSGQSIFVSHATNLTDLVGLDHVDSLSSPAGVPVFKDHEYELIAVYNNTSSEDQDSMAIMFVYLTDSEYHGPVAVAQADEHAQSAPKASSDTATPSVAAESPPTTAASDAGR